MTEFLENYAIWIFFGLILLIFLIFLATAPCHAIFLLPFMGLPLFWLLPLGYALPVNIAAWLATPFLYRLIKRAMIRPIKDGFQSLIGTEAEVVSKQVTVSSVKYLVRAQGEGELWSAYSTNALDIGEWVNIVAVKGIGVVVERRDSTSVTTKRTVGSANERHCH